MISCTALPRAEMSRRRSLRGRPGGALPLGPEEALRLELTCERRHLQTQHPFPGGIEGPHLNCILPWARTRETA